MVSGKIVSSRLSPLINEEISNSGVSLRVTALGQVQRQGVCGNSVCEVQEGLYEINVCISDCPTAVRSPFGNQGSSCNGHGLYAAATSDCICHKGYVGDSCEQCQTGYTEFGSGLCALSVSEQTFEVTKNSLSVEENTTVITEPSKEDKTMSNTTQVWTPVVAASCSLAGLSMLCCCCTILVRRRKRFKAKKPRQWLHALQANN